MSCVLVPIPYMWLIRKAPLQRKSRIQLLTKTYIVVLFLNISINSLIQHTSEKTLFFHLTNGETKGYEIKYYLQCDKLGPKVKLEFNCFTELRTFWLYCYFELLPFFFKTIFLYTSLSFSFVLHSCEMYPNKIFSTSTFCFTFNIMGFYFPLKIFSIFIYSTLRETSGFNHIVV